MVSGAEIKHKQVIVVSDYLTVSQAAEYAGVTRQYIHSILSKFTPVSLGNETGPIVILRVELDSWIKERKKK